MYKKVNMTENTLQVLCLFTHGFDKDYYIREVERLLGLSPRTAQLILQDLEDKGILESAARGKIKSYRLRYDGPARRYLTLAEHYKLLSFLERNLLVKEAVEQIRPFVNGIGIVFGSHAKGTATRESDLDIFIAGQHDREAVKRVSRTLGVGVSLKPYPLAAFRRNVKRDFLLIEILKDHVVFRGAEQFIDTVLNG